MMQLTDKATKRHFWATTIWLILPTIVMSFLLFNLDATSKGLSHTLTWHKSIILGSSMLFSALFYSFRFRLLPTLIALLLLIYVGFKTIEFFSSGEFQSFNLSILYIRISFLGIIGWFIGYLLLRYKLGAIVVAIFGITYLIPELARNQSWYEYNESDAIISSIAKLYTPIIIYAIYIIAVSNIIFSLQNRQLYFWQSLHKRVFLLSSVLVVSIITIWYFFNTQIINTIEGIANNNQYGENSLLVKKEKQQNNSNQNQSKEQQAANFKENGEGLTMNDLLKMGGRNAKGNLLLFAAYIDNFVPESNMPNPLYLAMYYYTVFDTTTETFLKDSLATPDNGIFNPDLNSLPIYFTEKDTTVLTFTKNNLYQKDVEIELYKKNIDISVFTAPTTAYEVQPIAIDKDYAKEFRTAYKAKSKVSTLNSAYFIYNIDNPLVLEFQEQRFNILRQHNDYTAIDTNFLKYYTQFPTGKNYDSIKNLAFHLAKDKTTIIDKVLAIKQHFLERDASGKRIFAYSDNPGIPELPSASRLNYFLFENKKGYCAYYAGATLYLLRALNIPSRIVGGFLTEDRSSENNKGWYWYYADQAHAWVQVYFPELGWIDFDTTIDNEDARESPQADGTPPIQPPKPTLVIDGKFVTIDTVKKTGQFSLSKYILNDSTIVINRPIDLNIDLSNTVVRIDTALLPITTIDIADSITGIKFKTLPEKITEILQGNNTNPINIEEIHTRKVAVTNNVSDTKSGISIWNNSNIKYFILFGITILIILGIGWSYFKWLFLKWKANRQNQTNTDLLNNQFNAFYYYLNKMQLIDTPNMLLLAEMLDKKYQTDISKFITIYQKHKYNTKSIELNAAEKDFIENFLNKNTTIIQQHFSKRAIIKNFIIN